MSGGSILILHNHLITAVSDSGMKKRSLTRKALTDEKMRWTRIGSLRASHQQRARDVGVSGEYAAICTVPGAAAEYERLTPIVNGAPGTGRRTLSQ